nr:replication-relaxation family protein [Planosporangium flavigriseum]
MLVLLDRHRVMTTGQLARATGAPERTVRYRMERLRAANLVECARPGRESGSAPRHWWLRPAGARLVTGTAAAEGRPSAMFATHAAAITEVWLALTEHGPAIGVEPEEWLTDRAGWQEWDGTGTWSRRYRLTPDAVTQVLLASAGSAVIFVEVDLASMTQTLLKQKVVRYLAYAADRAWLGVHPHCPPLLLLTTTATRAATFVRAAQPLLDQHERAYATGDRAEAPVVAACGHVCDPARAIVEPCWMLHEAAAGELTLAEILTERLDAQAESEAWHTYQDTVVRRRADLDALGDLRSVSGLADWLGSECAAAAMRAVVGDDPAKFLDTEPNLANQIIDWSRVRRKIGRFEARDLARPLVAVLEDRYAALWTEQARRLLVAEDHLVAAHPPLCRLAATLAAGNLATSAEISMLGVPPTGTRRRLQHQAYDDYPARRAAAVDSLWQAMGRRARRHTSQEKLAANFDKEHLLICDTCELIYPKPEQDETLFDRCPYCDGTLLDWADRASIVSLTRRLDDIREHLQAVSRRRCAPCAVPTRTDR